MRRWIAAMMLACFAQSSWRAEASCPNCRCDASVVPIAFGNYNPVDPSPTRVAAPVEIACLGHSGEETVGFNIALASGKGSYARRQMIHGNARLDYNLYADPAHTAVWGNGTDGSTEVGGTLAAGTTRILSVYGEIPALQPVPDGSYFDIIVATVTY